MKHSGNVTLRFEIERFRLANGNWDLVGDGTEDSTLIMLNIKASGYYDEGRNYGPPDKCYPAESDISILSAKDDTNKDWLEELTETERSAIEDEVMQKMLDLSYYTDD